MTIADSNILLETGTNELAILEFIVSGNSFGINVAKITQLMQAMPLQRMPHSHPCVEGIFQPRDVVYTIVDLAKYLELGPSQDPEKDLYMIAHLNQVNIGFHVHGVEGIHRLSWQQIEKPDSLIYGGEEGVVTGIFKAENKIISILDFEKITWDINPETGMKMHQVQENKSASRAEKTILVAEDSTLLRRLIIEALNTAGFTDVISTTNGEEAWDYLKALRKSDDIRSALSCVITDIEMPKMDGHRLTKLIKEDPVLKKLPVVIFSSMIDDNMQKKGLEVGADAQISKPEIGILVETIEQAMDEYDRIVK